MQYDVMRFESTLDAYQKVHFLFVFKHLLSLNIILYTHLHLPLALLCSAFFCFILLFQRTPESETPDPSDRTDTSETSNSDPVPATRESSGAGHQGNSTSGNVSKMDSNERLNGSTKKVRLQVNTGASMGSSAFSSAENEGEGTTRSIELVGRGDDDKKSVSRAKGRNDDWKEGDRDRDRERHPREPRERDQRNREPREKGEGRDRDRDRGEPRERGEGREREGRERGEGREKGAGRTRERPAVPPKPVPQPDFNMDSDFPNLVRALAA